MIFRDRVEAGRRLARELSGYSGRTDVVVLGLVRGGVPVAFEVAHALGAPLDIFVVRKLGMPGQEELAVGAIASGGVCVFNEDLLSRFGFGGEALDRVARREEKELARRERAYRGTREALPVFGRIVILVDDGLATGASMRAAVTALRRLGPARIVAAAPVGAAETCEELRGIADEVVCAETPEPFWAVGNWYEDFSQTTDEEVRALLESAREEAGDRSGKPVLYEHAT
jgi:putative phosphoribosyl transferase